MLFFDMQDILVQVFALAHIEGIDLVEHIKLKMQYNESRPYLHGVIRQQRYMDWGKKEEIIRSK